MATFFFDVSVGGASTIKVEADDEEAAEAAAEAYFIDDWNNAGPLRFGDVHVQPFPETVEHAHVDASIIATQPGEQPWYERAPDDPAYDGDDD